MSRENVDFWVGLFMLIGLVAVLFLALQAANLTSFQRGTTYTLTAHFDNIGGLKPRAAVRSAGVVVGRVSAITFDDQTFQARVTMAMNSEFAFPRDTSASILTSGLLGEQYIGLVAGGDDRNLAQGDRIQFTQSAVVLENLISQFLFNQSQSTTDGAASAD